MRRIRLEFFGKITYHRILTSDHDGPVFADTSVALPLNRLNGPVFSGYTHAYAISLTFVNKSA